MANVNRIRKASLWQKFRRKMETHFLDSLRWKIDASFDYWHGTDTSGITLLEDLQIDSLNVQHGVFYEPTPLAYFDMVMGKINLAPDSFEFIDLGAGKGRVLLQAARYPFSKILGVEFSEKLAHIARSNLLKFHPKSRKCYNVEVISADVSNFAIPSSHLVIYLFNPFNKTVLNIVLDNIKISNRSSSLNRKIFLIYIQSNCRKEIECSGIFSRKLEIRPNNTITRKPGWITKIDIYTNVTNFCWNNIRENDSMITFQSN